MPNVENAMLYDLHKQAVPIEYGIDDTGDVFPLGALPQTLVYTAGVLTSISVTDGTYTWTQTLSYTDGDLTGVSVWVRS